jgi:hypothetical protein
MQRVECLRHSAELLLLRRWCGEVARNSRERNNFAARRTDRNFLRDKPTDLAARARHHLQPVVHFCAALEDVVVLLFVTGGEQRWKQFARRAADQIRARLQSRRVNKRKIGRDILPLAILHAKNDVADRIKQRFSRLQPWSRAQNPLAQSVRVFSV